MFPVKFKLLNELAAELQAHGFYVAVEADTICVGRPVWDRYQQQFFMMLSAAPYIKYGNKAFLIHASEQYDENGELKKYSIKLSDEAKTQIKAWELDTKNGQHVHDYIVGLKDKAHTPYRGSISDIAANLMAAMREY